MKPAEHATPGEQRIAVAAQRARDLEDVWRSELELRDSVIVEEVDAGLSTRRAAKSAGLSLTGLLHVLARSG